MKNATLVEIINDSSEILVKGTFDIVN